MFHLARLVSAVLMVFSFARLFHRLLPEAAARLALILATFGAGFGWLAVALGGSGADMWVPEAFPFLSAYVTPHFALGLALLAFLLTPETPPRPLAAAALLLGIVAPYGVPVAGLTLGLVALVERRRPAWTAAVAVGVGGLPPLALALWIAQADPRWVAWNVQILTPLPSALELLAGFGPFLLLAAPALLMLRRAADPGPRRLALWLLATVILIAVPSAQARRFLMGALIPLAGLAALTLARLAPARQRLALVGTLTLTAPSLLLVVLAGLAGALDRSPQIYLLPDEARALAWLAEHAAPDDLIAADPSLGPFVPPFTGARVVYGHPFETPHAAATQAALEAALRGELSANWLAAIGADWLIWGPPDRAVARPGVPPLHPLPPAAAAFGDVTIYPVIP
jgi:hypothetical protein